jgi:hypothetical protein
VHDLWDVADITITGEAVGGHLGEATLEAGDLDGDGFDDLLLGACCVQPGGKVYGFRGPLLAGDRLVTSADWTFSGVPDATLSGSSTIGDFDGDGRPDLAVGGYSAIRPGAAYVFLAPPPGTYGPADAAVALASGVGVIDGFGAELDAGDLDGDGRDDLAVGAPLDPVLGRLTGSLLLFPGGGVP